MTSSISLFFLCLAFPNSSECTASHETQTEEKVLITLKMEDCQVSRSRIPTGVLEALTGSGKDQLIKRGVVELEGKKYTLYLPKAKSYTVKNTGKRDHDFENNSTLLTIDQKGDAKFTEADNWFANLPVRLGDKMFDVVDIAKEGNEVILRPSKAPLSGALIGRCCPDFTFKTADGKEISRETLQGKAFLLDIWSIT